MYGLLSSDTLRFCTVFANRGVYIYTLVLPWKTRTLNRKGTVLAGAGAGTQKKTRG